MSNRTQAGPNPERCDSDPERTGMGQPVVHFEIIGTDPAKLRSYYAELFGWEFDTGDAATEASPAPPSRRPAGQSSRIVRSSWRRRAGSPSQSISTILPCRTVNAPTENGSPSRVVTTPTAPLTSAGFMTSPSCE
jgi:hypothetical protein